MQLVFIVPLKRFLTKDQASGSLCDVLSERLLFLRTVNPAEHGVAFEDPTGTGKPILACIHLSGCGKTRFIHKILRKSHGMPLLPQ